MASVRSRAQVPVGSAQWCHDENDQTLQFGIQEAEDFAFAARNEVEWLNEHMADIFTRSQVDVTDLFKTPGKLRGKTPRTARKRNPQEIRQPLTDVFSTNARIGSSPSRDLKKASESAKPAALVVAFSTVQPKAPKTNTDSGYHGMSEDEMDTDDVGTSTGPSMQVFGGIADMTQPLQPILDTAGQSAPSTERATTTEGSFHSAREELMEIEDGKPASRDTAVATQAQVSPMQPKGRSPGPPQPTNSQPSEENVQIGPGAEESVLEDPIDDLRSPSQGSSPVKQLVRKSSLTFAALPAREPLTTKKSLGARVSRTSHVDQARNVLNRGSFLGRFTSGKSLGAARHTEADTEIRDAETGLDEPERPALGREESDGDGKVASLHNKSSTQRLHDKINMLGKSQPARPTKSIPAAAIITDTSYPEPPQPDARVQENTPPIARAATEEDDDDWIKPPPPHSRQSPRPQLPKSTTMDVMENIRGKQNVGEEEFEPGYYDDDAFKETSHIRPHAMGDPVASGNASARSASAAMLASPSGREAATEAHLPRDGQASVMIPKSLEPSAVSTTPLGTPRSKQNIDGPISASKSKLQSIMKTARGLFTSSAGVSAQAKFEALASPSTRTRSKLQDIDSNNDTQNLAPADCQRTPVQQISHIGSPKKQHEGRSTRSSTEKEVKRKQEEARLNANPNEIMKPEPSQSKIIQPSKSTRQSPRRLQKQAEARQMGEDEECRPSNVNSLMAEQSMGLPQAQVTSMQRPKDPRRPIKPAKEATSKPKPQTIRVGALSQQRIPLSNVALSSSLQESLPAAPTRPGLYKKASNASIQTSTSNSSLKSSVTSATTKPKALLAAERKKEQDEKEARRKLEQKREIERKRAAQQEEQRQQERLQREEVERQRERERSVATEDPKKAASRQLIEKRRLELAKKEEQRVPQRALNDSLVSHERPAPPAYRPELGGTRAPSRLHTVQDHGRPATNHPPPNPARPAIKRVIESEAEEEAPRPVRAPTGPSYQQNEAKRRRTGDEEIQEVVRPTMAPPIRQSNIRKDLHKPSLFNNNYGTAPPPATHHQPPNGLLKPSTSTNPYQHQASRTAQHPHDMAKYASTRPPFADAPNPAAPTHKTPLPKHLAPHPPPPTTRSSPHFPNGENIHLDDIPTDTDSDASPDPRRPTVAEWVQSPNLRELIRRQEETMNPDAIFGPQQSPHMEEMFKDRHQRFRNRTSSAAWVQDRLTSEEIQRDVEGREKLRRDGGWTFGL